MNPLHKDFTSASEGFFSPAPEGARFSFHVVCGPVTAGNGWIIAHQIANANIYDNHLKDHLQHKHIKQPRQSDDMAALSNDATLFDDSFRITDLDQSKYDRVARIKAISTTAEMSTQLTLDVNTELFPCAISDNMKVILATSLTLDGSKDEETGWRDATKSSDAAPTLADAFDYVCHGRIYKFEDDEDGQNMCGEHSAAILRSTTRPC